MQETEREQEGDRSEENDRQTAPVSDSVPVRPETSAESALVPAVIDTEELDHKETDNGDVAIGEGVMRYFMTTVISKLQFGFCLDLGKFLTIFMKSCPDLHIRSIIKLLEHEELTPEQKNTVFELSMSWDLPAVTKTNRRWLHNKRLLHAVIGRTMRQIKQLRKGLKDVTVWPLLTSRPDVVPLLFPKMTEMQFTPQMLLGKITWPVEDSDDEDFDIESTCRITGFLRMFIET
ncbi:hypothetical protein L3Q82_008486, partial [Scortum barcoo]